MRVNQETFAKVRNVVVFAGVGLLPARVSADPLITASRPPYCTAGDVGFAGDARFFEKNGSTFRSIRSPTLLVWSPSYSS